MSVFENTFSVFGDPLSVFEKLEFPNTLSHLQIHSMSVFGRTIEGWTTTDVEAHNQRFHESCELASRCLEA